MTRPPKLSDHRVMLTPDMMPKPKPGADLDWTLPLALEFVECDACRAKPGTPELCFGCRRNRAVMEALLAVTTPRDQRQAQERAAKILWPPR